MEEAQATVEVRVRYAETDQMGRAHHSHHLVWCEIARTTLMRERGFPYADVERRGLLLPVSRAEVEYRRGVGYDEVVRIHTSVESVRSRSVTFAYRLVRAAGGDLVARARTELVCTTGEGRPTRIPDDLRRALDATPGEEAAS